MCKEDNNVAHSARHPDLAKAKSPPTKESIKQRQSAQGPRLLHHVIVLLQKTRKSRLSNNDVVNVLIEH